MQRAQQELSRALKRESKTRLSARRLRREVESERSRVVELETEVDLLSVSLNLALEEQYSVQALSDDSEQKSLTLKRRVKTDRQHLRRTLESKFSIAAERDALCQDNENLREELSAIRSELQRSKELETKISTLDISIADASAEIDDLKLALSAAVAESGCMRSQLASSQLNILLLSSSNAAQLATLSDAQLSNEILQRQLHEEKNKTAKY